MSKKVVSDTLLETKEAMAFLAAIGADIHNAALIQTVVAWLRTADQYAEIKGIHNPFNIPPGVWDKLYRSGVRVDKNGTKLSQYHDDLAALKALASFLLRQSKDSNLYFIVKAFRTGNAVDALASIALNVAGGWFTGYYKLNVDVVYTQQLYSTFNSFTTIQLPTVKTTTTKPPKPPPVAPPVPIANDLYHIRPDYIDPMKAKRFYDERHPGLPALPE